MRGEIGLTMRRKMKHIKDICLEFNVADDRIVKKGNTKMGEGGGSSSYGGLQSSPVAV